MVLSRLLRAGEAKTLKRLRAIADHINDLEGDYKELSDAELRALTDTFRQRLADGETTDDLLPEAFAVVREAATRTLGQRHFDVQLMGGAALHLGNIAEMKTGEGKTLVSTLPVYLNALEGKGVHVVTTNDYLAQRDSEWMGRVHRFLGLDVGVILSQQTPDVRRRAYAADITYGTNNEFGFDYLRDNMAWSKADLVQRGHFFAVVDEVDSILIDEARTPLIISGPADQSSKWYSDFARLVPRLQRDVDYEVDESKRTVGVTEDGVAKVEQALGIDNLYESVNTPLVGFLNNALKAKELYKRDKDYIVVSGEVLIVDEFTGRVLHGRRYNEGMHQAIEAKEGVEIKAENQTLATITLQNYFRLYEKLSGMTGTAQTEAAELHQTYKLGVVPIPPNKPVQRLDESDLIYKTEDAKFDAVVQDIEERYEKGQPVLVGTASVEKSEALSKLLLRAGVPHEVLNAKNHAREAAIIAQAGRSGAVTVATNMAGRGTDIVLGGNPDFTADLDLRQRGLSPAETPEEYEAAWTDALDEAQRKSKAEAEKVREAGGLYVLGTERHESRRIDNQLRGRSGRQGDPGESRFYLSLGDDLMRRVGGGTVEMLMTRLRMPDDVPIEHNFVSRAIKSAQTQVEQQNYEIRKNVLKYDEVMNKQRTVIYDERRRVLDGEDLHVQVQNMITDVITAYVQGATAQGYGEDWDLDTLWTALRTLFPIQVTPAEIAESPAGLTRENLLEAVLKDARDRWAEREEALSPEITRELERRVVLSVLDRKWREHLYEMDYLKEGIGLRAMAQRDPLVEYQREGFDMFAAMLDSLKEESVGFLYNLQVQVVPAEEAAQVEAAQGSAVDGAGGDGVGTGQGAPAAAPAAVGAGNGAAPAARRPLAPPKPVGGKQAAGATRTVTRVRPVQPLPSQETPTAAAPSGDSAPSAFRAKGLARPAQEKAPLQYSGPAEAGGVEESGAAEVRGAGGAAKEPGRNAPCPCGSGKKYKVCHGRPGSAGL
ncbi:preprotein translocase subunit SecA [Nakamurella endophytica]|uniref:Protein translocase subunit SecA n=1 Tax=Nakamurella endophytica TaxID=1748367 RepID=A0A917SJU7_9ACTN|nr:preprotein translocase subunit SecA [Nakamurella endophytica]GGL85962.1 protein translocase subunit SecA 1 [Nakamurella endophytica]